MLNYTFKPTGLMNMPGELAEDQHWPVAGCLLTPAGAKGDGRSKSPQIVAVKLAPWASHNMFTKPQL